MDKVNIYLPFTKADNDQKIVEGFATTESVDSQGEIVEIDAVKKALPDYMKFANIREMHQWSAVGKALAAKIDDKKKGLYIRGKIIDKEAWEKVKEKVYNGFSIGGKVIKKIGNKIQELILNEISLVDRPANPEAVFNLVKFEGGEIVEKQLPIAPYGVTSEEAYPGIKLADQLIAMTTQLTYLKQKCDMLKRSSKHIERAIAVLKNAALIELQSEKNAIVKILDEQKLKRETNLLQIKDSLQKVTMSRNFDGGWDGYFEQLRRVL